MVVSSTRDTAGILARTVAEVDALDSAMTAGPDEGMDLPAELRGLRLGVVRAQFFPGMAPDVEEVIERRLAELDALGVQLVDVGLPAGTDELIVESGFPIAFYETPRTLQEYLSAFPGLPDLAAVVDQCGSPDVKNILTVILGSGRISAAAYHAAVAVQRPALQAVFRTALLDGGLDAFVAPTTPLTAAPIGQSEVTLGEYTVSAFEAYTRTTAPYSCLGWPGLSIPAGFDGRGLPIGIALDGPPGSDRRLVAIGRACEQVFGFLPPPDPGV